MADTSFKYFTQVLSVISELGVSESDCLNAAKLSALPTSDRVDAKCLTRILNFAESHLSEPLIGIKCGLKYPILQYTRPSEFLRLCANLMHAADLYNQYCPLFHSVGTPSGVISKDGVDRMVWNPNFDQNSTAEYRQFIELIMTNLVTSINWLAWKTPNAVKRLNIKHEPSLPLSQYKALFDCDIKFNQEEYSLILLEGVKDTPFAMYDQEKLAKICIKYDTALNEFYEGESLIDRIELQIRRSIEKGSSNKSAVARVLGLSERSMARALKNEGTCFKNVKNNVLKSLAVAKIRQGLPLVEVAHSLGYNDQPAFTRAYKKWFGCSPRKHISSGY